MNNDQAQLSNTLTDPLNLSFCLETKYGSMLMHKFFEKCTTDQIKNGMKGFLNIWLKISVV